MTAFVTPVESAFIELQMATALPPGPVVDEVVSGLLVPRGGPDALLAFWECVGAPTNLSAGVVGSLDLSGASSRWLPAVLVGLRDLDAVRVLAARADEDWLRWAVYLNPVSRFLGASELPLLPSLDSAGAPVGVSNSLLSLMAAPAIPHVSVLTQNPDQARVLSAALGVLGEDALLVASLWPWGLPSIDYQALPTGFSVSWHQHSVDVDLFFNTARREAFQSPSAADPEVGYSMYVKSLLAESDPSKFDQVLEVLEDGAARSMPHTAAGGLAYDNPWLPYVLLHSRTAWRDVLNPYWKPVSARHLGRGLASLVRLDVGVWQVAVDLLREWGDEPLMDWLRTVQALAPNR